MRKKKTALHAAIENNCIDATRALLEGNVSLIAVNKDDETAAALARRLQRTDIYK